MSARSRSPHTSTSRVNKLAAIGRAGDSLGNLDEFMTKEVLPPKQFVLRRVIRQWRRLIDEAGGVVGCVQVAGPVANPYVLNNPVKPPLFQGREDVLRRLEELWPGEGQKPSVVLYGHRRMGKSSILQNLGDGARFGKNALVVDFNMQRVGNVRSVNELLHNLALALFDALPSQIGQEWQEPNEAKFTEHNPYTAFDRFLRQLDRVGSVTAIPVTFLSEGAARQLITNPAPDSDFAIDYDQDVIDLIISLTNGQPFLIQLIGHGLVTRLNRQTYEDGIERERRFSLSDLNAVIEDPELFRDGHAYFQGVWAQAESDASPAQPAILSALSRSEIGMTTAELAQVTRLSIDEVRRGLGILKQHDVVAEQNGSWCFTVELMRRWVAQTHGPS